MKQLLEAKNLLAEPRVQAAAEALGVELRMVVGEVRPRRIYKSIETVALQMRDACNNGDVGWSIWRSKCWKVQPQTPDTLFSGETMIIAATLAFEAADAAGDE